MQWCSRYVCRMDEISKGNRILKGVGLNDTMLYLLVYVDK